MNILSSFSDDYRHNKQQPGSFEWWYFDAVDMHNHYRLVIIFYEGVPFSTKYIDALKNGRDSDEVFAQSHPGISISVYDRESTIYYSLSEFTEDNCDFADECISIRVGQSTLKGVIQDNRRVFQLHLEETLPCGDHLESELTFISPNISSESNKSVVENGHKWFVLQSQAVVEGSVLIQSKNKKEYKIDFLGRGYHDHNLGNKPLHEMMAWYWGRFHFPNGTFIFYKSNNDNQSDKSIGWWVGKKGEIEHVYSSVHFDDFAFNPFLLKNARRMIFRTGGSNPSEIEVQMIHSIDSGPFYQRFIAEAIVHFPDESTIQRASGITEYIEPERIQNKMFWPLVHMRYRYVDDKPHAVQRFASLYRLTW